MADEQRKREDIVQQQIGELRASKKPNGKVSVPIWVLVTVALSFVIGGAGWISAGLQAKADASTIKQDQAIAQLQHEDSNQNAIITSNTFAISDIKTQVADRLGRIETTLTLIEKRTR